MSTTRFLPVLVILILLPFWASGSMLSQETADYRVNVEDIEVNKRPSARLKIYSQKYKKSSRWIEIAANPETLVVSQNFAFVLCNDRKFKGKIFCINLSKHVVDKVIETDLGPRFLKQTPFTLLVLNTISASLMRINLENLTVTYEACPFTTTMNPFLSANHIIERAEDKPTHITFYARDSQTLVTTSTFKQKVDCIGYFNEYICLLEGGVRNPTNTPSTLHFIHESNLQDLNTLNLGYVCDTWHRTHHFLYLGDSKAQQFMIVNLKTREIVHSGHLDFPPLTIVNTETHVVVSDLKTLEYYDLEDHDYTHQVELEAPITQLWLTDYYLLGTVKDSDKIIKIRDINTLTEVASTKLPSPIRAVIVRKHYVYIFTTSGHTLIINSEAQKEAFQSTKQYTRTSLYVSDNALFELPSEKHYLGRLIPIQPSAQEITHDLKRIVDVLLYDPNLFKSSKNPLQWDTDVSKLTGQALWEAFLKLATDQKRSTIRGAAQKLLVEKNPIASALAFLAYNEGIYGVDKDDKKADTYLDDALVDVIQRYYEVSS